jgi:hypothetical protein
MRKFIDSLRWSRKAIAGSLILLLALMVNAEAKALTNAQDSPPANGQKEAQDETKAVSPSHREAAAQLLAVMNIESSIMPSLNTIVDAQIRQNPAMGQYRDIIMAWAKKNLTWENISSRFIGLLTDSFTEKEIIEMTAFYITPTGQKSLNQMPEIWTKASTLGAAFAREHSAELQKMISDRRKELDLEREAH